jgi:hypothetical protein
MSLQFDLETIKELKKDLETNFCPIARQACLGEKCWKFVKMEKVAYKEEVGEIDKATRRVKVVETGKVIIGTLVKCQEGIFPDMLTEARYAINGEATINKNGAILDKNGEQWGVGNEESKIIDIREMEKEQQKEIEEELEEV